jgi:hypothetical protein
MTKVLTLFAILIVSTAFSQGITDSQKLEAVRNAQRVERLTNELQQAEIKIGIRNKIIEALKTEISSWELDNKLLQDNYELALTRIEALQKKDNPGYGWNDFKNDALLVLGGMALGIAAILSL